MRPCTQPSERARTALWSTAVSYQGPGRLKLEPGKAIEVGGEHVSAKGVVYKLACLLRFDETSVFEFLHMVREGCSRYRDAISNVAAGTTITGVAELF